MNSISGAAGQAVVNSFGEQNKYGSFGNRVDRARDHAINNLKTGGRIIGYATATAMPASVAILNPKGTKRLVIKTGLGIQKFVKAVQNSLIKHNGAVGKKIYNIAKPFGKALKTIGQKIVRHQKAAAIGLFGYTLSIISGRIAVKHAYNAGKIDQKYEDKGRTQDILTKIDA